MLKLLDNIAAIDHELDVFSILSDEWNITDIYVFSTFERVLY